MLFPLLPRPPLCALFGVIALAAASARGEELAADSFRATLQPFLEDYCLDCHDAESKKGGMDLDAVLAGKSPGEIFEQLVKVHDQLATGEMPPKKKARPDAARQKVALDFLSRTLQQADAARQAREGRVRFRRLNRVEYENTLRDLLALPQLEVKEMLPADTAAHGFDNVGEALNVSYVQMARYLEAADLALDEAITLKLEPEQQTVRIAGKNDGGIVRALKAGEGLEIGEAIGLLRQGNTAQTPWRWGKFKPTAGTYRVRLKGFGFRLENGAVNPPDRTHVVTFYAKEGNTKRWLATSDLNGTPEQPVIVEFTAYIGPGSEIEMFLATMDARNVKGKIDTYSGPGVAVEWLEAEGPFIEQWPPASHQRLFGDLPVEPWTPESGIKQPPLPMVVRGAGKRAVREPDRKAKPAMVVSKEPLADAERLLRDFVARAFRRPVPPQEVEPYMALVRAELEEKVALQEALRVGYKAVLCSPEFLYLQEPGPRGETVAAASSLDDYALASRLSYFLWSSMPDDELLSLAAKGGLRDPQTLRAQTERLLKDAKAQRFTENFTGQWLDLRKLTITEPDEQLYPEFDQLLQDSMTWETHAFFSEMLRADLGVAHFVDSDFVMINGRLAEVYDIPGVDGADIRKVPLPLDSVRGGILTQASVLKVTANGTTTSPVTRGAWVLDRILGQPASPPPPNTPAIEPDVRGATTIREQLEKHRSDASCASCHSKMDPPGFALESFDVIGAYRERYRSLEAGDEVKGTVRARPIKYKLGLPVDSSGVAPNGREFKNIEEFRRILLTEKEQIARGLTEKMLTYATGAGVSFADRAAVELILANSKESDYGVRTLIHEVVQSAPFQHR